MSEIKYIRQLPKLQEHQEWGCLGHCDSVKPMIYRNVYSESWDNSGNKISQKAENYYTCQLGHVLSVWDEQENDYIVLHDEAYQVRKNDFGLNLDSVAGMKEILGDLHEEYCRNHFDFLCFSEVSLECSLKNGETIAITHEYLNEIEAELKSEMILT